MGCYSICEKPINVYLLLNNILPNRLLRLLKKCNNFHRQQQL